MSRYTACFQISSVSWRLLLPLVDRSRTCFVIFRSHSTTSSQRRYKEWINEIKKRTRKETVWARMAFKDHATATTRGPPHAYCEQLIFKRINWRDWHAADDCCACTRRKADEIFPLFFRVWKKSLLFFSTYCVVCCHVGKKEYAKFQWNGRSVPKIPLKRFFICPSNLLLAAAAL